MTASKALLAALAYTKELGTRSIEVPEWKVDGNPLTIFWMPMTLAEREQILNNGNITMGSYVDLLVLKAIDASGQKLFTLADKPELRRNVEGGVIQRIGLKILETPKAEDVEKN